MNRNTNQTTEPFEVGLAELLPLHPKTAQRVPQACRMYGAASPVQDASEAINNWPAPSI